MRTRQLVCPKLSEFVIRNYDKNTMQMEGKFSNNTLDNIHTI